MMFEYTLMVMLTPGILSFRVSLFLHSLTEAPSRVRACCDLRNETLPQLFREALFTEQKYSPGPAPPSLSVGWREIG